LYG
jgi:hypothetical protein